MNLNEVYNDLIQVYIYYISSNVDTLTPQCENFTINNILVRTWGRADSNITMG